MHAMRRHPENRYQTADELLADLDRVDLLAGDAYDLSPERPLGSLGVGSGGKGLFSRLFKPR
jgi:hypothetical protein